MTDTLQHRRTLLQHPIARIILLAITVLCLLGSAASGFGLSVFYQEIAGSSEWPITKGVLLRTGIKQDDRGRFLPDVEYSYTVDGTLFSGSSLDYHDVSTRSRVWAEWSVEGMASGDTVTVYYDPADPKKAVLRPGANIVDLLPFLIPAFMAFLGGAALVTLAASFRKPARSSHDT